MAFSPEEISQILEEFFKVVGARQYIGPRIIPIFGRKNETSIEWDNSAPYEPLTIVLYRGNSYASRQYVPAGVPLSDTNFWAQMGNFNAQVEMYKNAVENVELLIEELDLKLDGEIENRDAAIEELRNALIDILTPFPVDPNSKYGNEGQVLTTLGNGKTQWSNPVVPSDEQAAEAVDSWLTVHPEATTTVTDGSVTKAKLYNALVQQLVFAMHTLPDTVLDLNDVEPNTMYTGNTSIERTNVPSDAVTTAGTAYYTLITITPQTSNRLVRLQLFIRHPAGNYTDSAIWFRSKWGASVSVWSDWTRVNAFDYPPIVKDNLATSLQNLLAFSSHDLPTDITDLNDVLPNTLYYANTTVTRANIPNNLVDANIGAAFYTLITLTPQITNRGIRTQIIVRQPIGGYTDTAIWVRSKWGSGTAIYSEWIKVERNKVFYADATNFVDVIAKAVTIKDSIVYLKANTKFDMLSAKDTEYWLNNGISGSTRYYGMKLYNGIKIIGQGGSKIVCNYDGDDASLIDGLSIFNIFGDATIENVEFDCRGGRYCIHDDNQTALGYKTSNVTIRNCVFHTNRLGGIGGGTHGKLTRNITNCMFFKGSNAINDFGVSWHTNNSSSVYTAKIYVSGCVFIDCSYRYRQYENLNHAPWYYMVSNNHMNVSPTSVIEGDSPNTKLIAYNNVLES